MEYVLMILLTIFTGFMAFGVFNMYRNRKLAAQQYHIVLDRLTGRMEDFAKEHSLKIDDSYFTVTDTKEGILIGVDTNQKQCMISNARETFAFPGVSMKGCEILIEADPDPAYYQRLGVKLIIEGREPVELILGSNRLKLKGYIGSMIMQNVEGLHDYLLWASGKKKPTKKKS